MIDLLLTILKISVLVFFIAMMWHLTIALILLAIKQWRRAHAHHD